MSHSPLKILKDQWKLLTGIGIICAFIALLFSLLFTLNHRADSEVLVISGSGYGVDAYTALRSSERIGESLVNIIETGDFFAKVMTQLEKSETIDKSRFEELSERERRKLWSKTIDASLNYGSGMLTISTYHPNPKKAKVLNTVVLNVLINESSDYIGQEVDLKVVNPPLATMFPVKPNLIVNTSVGFLVGFMGSFLILAYRDQKHSWL